MTLGLGLFTEDSSFSEQLVLICSEKSCKLLHKVLKYILYRVFSILNY